ncbi:hypothetical protein COU57_01760 [Candidatus Pacearchaeota archaeon CG10_big_fil_rev_8_21_14_0_10_32_14]|nr:MAG: hypothetical protein COU57_01760 [Candidatus Pacearchaeota archaeon CG10_big_fil_rev_8_21_14_0_10_32_14]
MSDPETLYASKIKHTGPFEFKEFYRWCYDFLGEETKLKVTEDRYIEKQGPEVKGLDIFWTGSREITHYFKFEVKIQWKILGMKDIEIQKEGQKIKMQTGSCEIKLKGTLVRDYKHQFEEANWKTPFRDIYNKWVIPARIEEFEDKLIADCNNFLDQAKAYLELEGQRGGVIQI